MEDFMLFNIPFVAGVALAVLAMSAPTAQAAGCTGTSRQRIDCLEKQLDAMTAKVATAINVANQAKTAADEALTKVGNIKLPDLNNVRIQWSGHNNSCLYVEDGTGTVRVATTNPPTCDFDAQQRFNILLK